MPNVASCWRDVLAAEGGGGLGEVGLRPSNDGVIMRFFGEVHQGFKRIERTETEHGVHDARRRARRDGMNKMGKMSMIVR